MLQNYLMPKTGEKCTYAGYYKYSGHLDRSTIRCHPSFDEKEISLQVGHVFPPVITCSKDAFWTYVRAP
jgi:hypothetical protein